MVGQGGGGTAREGATLSVVYVHTFRIAKCLEISRF